MAKTIRYLRSRFKAEYWSRHIEVLSRYLPQAIIYGYGDEFYLYGRRLTRGCGFNGGITLHT